MESSSYKVVLNSSATRGQDDYIQHFGVLGIKWGVLRTPEQLGHKKSKKTYEFKPYKTDFPNTADRMKAYFKIPMVSILRETSKWKRDPEYGKKAIDFINQNKDDLTRRYLSLYYPLKSMAYETKFASRVKNDPETRTRMKNKIRSLKAENPNISVYQVSQRLGLSRSAVRQLEEEL